MGKAHWIISSGFTAFRHSLFREPIGNLAIINLPYEFKIMLIRRFSKRPLLPSNE